MCFGLFVGWWLLQTFWKTNRDTNVFGSWNFVEGWFCPLKISKNNSPAEDFQRLLPFSLYQATLPNYSFALSFINSEELWRKRLSAKESSDIQPLVTTFYFLTPLFETVMKCHDLNCERWWWYFSRFQEKFMGTFIQLSYWIIKCFIFIVQDTKCKREYKRIKNHLQYITRCNHF